MSNPRPQSHGFITVNTKTREILSELFKRRKPAHDVALASQNPERNLPIGVHQVMLYPGQTYDRVTYKF